MDKKLQNQLFKKYPKLFRQRLLNKETSPMFWGITCGNGWYNIINCLCFALDQMNDKVEACQVKQKFGGLRFYIDHGTEMQQRLCSLVGSISFGFCELCGSVDDVKTTKGGYVETLCGKCRKKTKK